MPCRNSVFGCKFLGSSATSSTHTANCAFNPCLWKNNGCTFTGNKATIGMHERACDYAVVYCLLKDKGCQFTCQRRDLPKHFEMCINRQKDIETAQMFKQSSTISNSPTSTATPTEKKTTFVASLPRPIAASDTSHRRAQQIINDKPVILNVGGQEITTSVRLLCRYPTSVLGLLGAHACASEQRPRRVFLDRDVRVIQDVLTFLRYGRLPPFLSPQEHILLHWEADYLGLPELAEALQAQSPLDSMNLSAAVELELPGFGFTAHSHL